VLDRVGFFSFIIGIVSLAWKGIFAGGMSDVFLTAPDQMSSFFLRILSGMGCSFFAFVVSSRFCLFCITVQYPQFKSVSRDYGVKERKTCARNPKLSINHGYCSRVSFFKENGWAQDAANMGFGITRLKAKYFNYAKYILFIDFMEFLPVGNAHMKYGKRERLFSLINRHGADVNIADEEEG
jgi:hypothetical protein